MTEQTTEQLREDAAFVAKLSAAGFSPEHIIAYAWVAELVLRYAEQRLPEDEKSKARYARAVKNLCKRHGITLG